MNRSNADNQKLPEDGLSPAALLRAVADGELPPDRLGSHRDDSVENRLAFERALRDATARVMDGPRAPEGLRRRVEQIAAERERLAEALEARADETRSRSFWGGRVVAALAAVLVLTVAGVFVARFTRVGGPHEMLAYRTNLATFVSAEHTRTLDDHVANRKYIYTTVGDAVRKLAPTLHGDPEVLPIEDGVAFRGAGPCGVPGVGPSCHFQYVITKSDGTTATVSIFIKQDHSELDLEENVAYRIKTDECGLSGYEILVWRRGGLLYTLVAGDDFPRSACLDLLAELRIARPDPEHEL
ncbi:MAG TPA: hypothetical protein ENK11_05285 [Phycisphaerales bacterium]|nr:hypothetical protein [Phycisphaerales bacterium]